jgi:hypothetical protein
MNAGIAGVSVGFPFGHGQAHGCLGRIRRRSFRNGGDEAGRRADRRRRRLELFGHPAIAVLDQNGVVVARHIGRGDTETWEMLAAKL